MKFKISLIIFAAFLISACDLTTTRSPEEPVKPRSNFNIATRPEDVILNLQNSFSDRVAENYIANFSQNEFNFTPSSGSVHNFPSLQNWDLKAEEDYFKNLINLVPQSAQISLDFSNFEYVRSNDSTQYFADYSLNVPFTDERRAKFYSGKLQFTIKRDSSLQWSITNWLDIKDQNNPSWSELKGGLY